MPIPIRFVMDIGGFKYRAVLDEDPAPVSNSKKLTMLRVHEWKVKIAHLKKEPKDH